MNQESDTEMEFLDSVVVKEEYLVQEKEALGFLEKGYESFGLKDPDSENSRHLNEGLKIEIEDFEDKSQKRHSIEKIQTEHVKAHVTLLDCKICKEIFLRNQDLIEHMKEHRDKRLEWFKCKLCKAKFVLKNKLLQHERAHEMYNESIRGRHYPCPHCSVVFGNKCDYTFHILNTHIVSNTTNGVPIPIMDFRPYECKFCDERFSRADDLITHSKSHAGETVKEPTHNCEICKKDFDSENALNKHKEVHKAYKCGICNIEPFDNLGELRKHIVTHSTKQRYSCKICGMTYFSVKDLRNHVYRCHNEVKLRDNALSSWTCSICLHCGKKFSSAQNLTAHLSSHGIKKLMKHLRVHCETCNRTFLTQKALGDHIVKDHKDCGNEVLIDTIEIDDD